MKLVSAIIITHNRLSLLPRAIDSVLRQTYPNIECLVVNDASSDGTAAYCSTRTDIRFIDIPICESKGGNHARNVGVLASRGYYVAFLDDDDYWLPQKIEKQIALLENKQCDLVYCGTKVELVENDGSIRYDEWHPWDEAQGDISKYILTHIVVLTSQIVVRRDSLLEIGLFDDSLQCWQEYEMTIRLAQKSPFYYIDDCLIVYRVNQHDRFRLSNQFQTWINSVHYVHRKHRELYASLSFRDWLSSRQMFWREGINRATMSNKLLYASSFWILLKLSRADKILLRYLKKIFQ